MRLEARTLRLLLCLAQHAGEVVSIDDLLGEVWAGVVVTSDSVYQAVASLRRVLGDDPKRPVYIATVPRLGYRMVASVGVWSHAPSLSAEPTRDAPCAHTGPDLGAASVHTGQDLGTATAHTGPDVGTASAHTGPDLGAASAHSPKTDIHGADSPPAHPPLAHSALPRGTPVARQRRRVVFVVAGALCVALALTLFYRGPVTPVSGTQQSLLAPPKSVAVLPFLDLTTEDMNEEYFADGMTEELIDKLSRIPGLRVPGATASFYFKGKHVKVPEIARSLGVLYVLDGSIRKADDTLRVAARLIRADDGYVIWSESYDRPFDNKLKVQDEIAGEVAKALQASIN